MNAEQLRANGWVETESGNWIKACDTLSGRGCQVMKAREVIKPKKRIRQSSRDLLNRLEQEYFSILYNQFPIFPRPVAQAVTFRLANGLKFTPDCFAFEWPGIGEAAMPTAWEIKGDWFPDDARKSLKVFAALYPQIRVLLVWKDNGRWQTQRINP